MDRVPQAAPNSTTVILEDNSQFCGNGDVLIRRQFKDADSGLSDNPLGTRKSSSTVSISVSRGRPPAFRFSRGEQHPRGSSTADTRSTQPTLPFLSSESPPTAEIDDEVIEYMLNKKPKRGGIGRPKIFGVFE